MKRTIRIGKQKLAGCFLFGMMIFLSSALADEVVAIPSSTDINQDENVSIEFKTTAEGVATSIGTVKYEAPDFDEVNVYASSRGVESHFINGKISVRQTQSVVVVLHPKRYGRLSIRNIHVQVNNQVLQSPDIFIEVHLPGQAPGLSRTAPRSSGHPQASNPPPPSRQQAATFFVRTEPNKVKVYKGEQVTLTYALYSRAQILNVQVERYPNVSGFLKEDIDVPLLRGRLEFSPAVVNGIGYRRAVLAQYAIYPLQEGTLPIDVFTGKFSYQSDSRMTNSEDPFAMLNQFFRAMQTATETRSSDRVNIEVMPLPAAGKPESFSGLVGDFDISATVDKNSVKAGEPINVKVKVEGKGHAGSLEQLKVIWPPDFELYENKSNTQFQKTGISTRIYEYMLIPKTKGSYQIPSIELSMFNPDSQSYQTRRTQAMSIEVLEGVGGNVYIPKNKVETADAGAKEDIRYWMASAPVQEKKWAQPILRGLAMASMVGAFLTLISLVNSSPAEGNQSRSKTSSLLREKIKALSNSSLPPSDILGEVETVLADALSFYRNITIGSLTRPEIAQALLNQSVEEALVKRIERLLESCENSRFIPVGANSQMAQAAANELMQIVEKLEKFK